MTDTAEISLKPVETGLRSIKWVKSVTLLILFALLLDRSHLLLQFAFRYTDEDQALLWYATTELEHGRWHEPCFYGQAYNSTLESVLAVPLHLIFRIPLPYALPIVTTLLGLLPYLLIAGVAWRRERFATAGVVLLIPLALPLPYAMVTAIPRGFVTGIAAASVAWVLFERNRGYIGWVIAGFLCILGGFLNPNASVVLLAIGISAWWKHFLRWQFYPTTLLGMSLAAPIPWWAYNFYKEHPNYDILRHPPLEFTKKFWNQGMEKLDLLLGHFSPIGDSGRLVLISLCALVGVLLLLMHFRGALAVLAAGALSVYALGINRIHESSTPSIFLSGSRMFLAIPIVWALAIFWIAEGLENFPKTWWARFLNKYVVRPLNLALDSPWRRGIALGIAGIVMIWAMTIAVIRHWDYKETILTYVRERRLEVWSQEDYQAVVDAIKKGAEEYNANLVLFAANEDKTLSYVVPALTDARIETLFTPWERRTWRLQQESKSEHSAIMLFLGKAPNRMAFYLNAMTKFSNVKIVSKHPKGAFVIIKLDSDGKTPLEVARMLGIEVRRF